MSVYVLIMGVRRKRLCHNFLNCIMPNVNLPKLLIIDKEQFGQLTDLYKWCENLREEYNITVLTANHGRKVMEMDGVNVRYVPFNFPYMIRGIIYILYALCTSAFFKGPILVEYFKGCSVLKLLCPWRKMIMDVRTFSIEADADVRNSADAALRKESRRFDLVSTLSKGIAGKIGLDTVRLLPLGADVISTEPKDYMKGLNLLYIGTFTNRKLDVMLRGIKLFRDRHLNLPMSVDIVGDGLPGMLDELKKQSKELGLEEIVKFHGYVPLTQVKPFFDRCNVGLSFVPITSYYEHQPPTKTFEYVLSGLFCIATATGANKEIITPENGLLIQDTPESLCDGLEQYLAIRPGLNETTLRASLSDSNWNSIAHNYLVPILDELSQK